MVEKDFNLLRERWILAMGPAGNTEEVSLIDLLARAQEFRGLAGELPTQDVAVLRLVLAVLHAVFSRARPDGAEAPLDSPGDALLRWKTLWDANRFPMAPIEDYLNQWEDRFYLFHPTRPFYQVPGLDQQGAAFGPFPVSKLNGELAESDNKTRLFPNRTGKPKVTLTYAEAVRWLLYFNAYAETFGKLEAKHKPSKEAPSLGVGWLGKLGPIIATGNNLFETLLLNFVLLDSSGEPWAEETPIWEAASLPKAERNEIVMPDNPSALLTMQSRRLQLIRENGLVTKFFFISGDFFPKQNAFTEQMTVWYNAAKRGAAPIYQPRTHKPSRLLWQDFAALAAQSEGIHRPGIISWLATLRYRHLLPRTQFRFQTTGVTYGTMQAMVEDTFEDSVSFNADLLTDLSDAWVSRITDEIETTELLVRQLASLVRDLTMAAGGHDDKTLDGRANAAREQAYFQLDSPFRKWLESIDPESQENMDEKCEEWWAEAQRIVWALGRELVDRAGPKAFVGRELNEKVKGKEVMRRYTAPEAYNRFQWRTSSRQALKGGEHI